ncbi:unnamed protein product [Caenorhabditis nigoni]
MNFSHLLLLSLFSITHACNDTNTWLVLENFHESDCSTFPAVDFQNNTFCVSTENMTTDGQAFYTSTKLMDPNEKSHFEQLNYSDLDKNKQTCTFTDPTVQGCLSHCQDKNLEKVVITAVMASSNTTQIVQQISKNSSLQSKIVVISALLDVSLTWDQLISYDYYNDPHFCAVLVNIKKNLAFPYAVMTTVQNVF